MSGDPSLPGAAGALRMPESGNLAACVDYTGGEEPALTLTKETGEGSRDVFLFHCACARLITPALRLIPTTPLAGQESLLPFSEEEMEV